MRLSIAIAAAIARRIKDAATGWTRTGRHMYSLAISTDIGTDGCPKIIGALRAE